jgi:hypothetical protein
MKLKVIRRYWDKAGNRRIKPGQESKFDVGNLESVRDEVVSFCCDEMEKAWGDHFVHFGELDALLGNLNGDVNIYHCSPYPEGAAWSEMAIRFCPFCAEPIEILEDETGKP